MVESAIYFLIGFLAASLLALVAAPAISRRATRLANARARLLSPLSETQARAERDALRGQHAVEIARMDRRLASLEDSRAAALAELGRRATQIVHLQELSAERRDEIARQRRELSDLGAEARDLDAQRGALEVAARDLGWQRDAANESLREARDRISALETQIDEYRAIIASLETRATSLEVELDSTRRAANLAAKASETERARLNAALSERTRAAEALQSQLGGAEALIAGLRSEIEGRSQEARGLRERLLSIEPMLARSEAAREELALENSRQLARIAQRDAALERVEASVPNKDLAALRSRLAEAEASLQAVVKGDHELRQSIARLGREIVKAHGQEGGDEPGGAQIVAFARRETASAGHAGDADRGLDHTIASGA